MTGMPPYAIEPGAGIGPFRLGMSPDEIADVCRQTGLTNESAFATGLHVGFSGGRAVRVELGAGQPLSLAGEPLEDWSDDNVRRLLDRMCPPARDWTERDGLVVFHWEMSDRDVFSFMVYAPGFRDFKG